MFRRPAFEAVTAFELARSTVSPLMNKLAWLKTLKASPRSCNLYRSLKLMVLYKPKSTFQKLSPRKALRALRL